MENKLIYGFLDESPSLNAKDYFFCVAILLSHEDDLKTLRKIISAARSKIFTKNQKSNELKFHNAFENIRLYVLKEISKQNISLVSLIIDKETRNVKDTPENYGLVVGKLTSLTVNPHKMLVLTLDKKYTNPKELDLFFLSCQKSLARFNKKGASVSFNPPQESQKEPLIQLADFVAGALNYEFNRKDNHYSQIINSKFKIKKVLKWTELKKGMVKT